MNKRYLKIRNTRITRIIINLTIVMILVGILQKQSTIPVVEHSIDLKKDTVINIDIYDPYSNNIFFKMYDITKTKYVYHISNDVQRFRHLLTFNHTKENIDFSPVIDVDLSIFGSHDMSIYSKANNISFYTQQVMAENIQTTRLFFLTELILFFMTLFAHQLIKLVLLVSSGKTGKIHLYNNSKWLKRCTLAYFLGVLFFTIVLYRINIMPIVEVESSNTQVKKSSWVYPYDISRSYYRIKPSREDNTTYTFISDQIVAFTPMYGKPSLIGPTTISYNMDNSQNEDITFYVENLESQNIQDIRIFIVTTILLGLLGRWLFYMKKLIKYKWKLL